MKFFRKASSKPESEANNSAMSHMTDSAENIAREIDFNLEPEEALKQWFELHYNNNEMPNEVMRAFRIINQNEMKKFRLSVHILDAGELKRLQESIQLQETKITNLDHTIGGLIAQKEWIHKNKELMGVMSKHNKAYFDTNKEYNAHLDDVHELQRYEAFEEEQGIYERIKVKEALLAQVRADISRHSICLTEAVENQKTAFREAELQEKAYQESKNSLFQIQNPVAEGYGLKAKIELYENSLKTLNNDLAIVEESLNKAEDTHAELEDKSITLSSEASKQAQLRQNLEPQQRMLEKGDVIQAKLTFFQSMKTRKEKLHELHEATLHKQNEQDEKLNTLFQKIQAINAELKTLQGELKVHQNQLVGLNSYNLQQRTMTLKSKQETLTSAIQLWKQISNGFVRVDEKGQEIMRMKHENDALKAQIMKLEPEVNGQNTQCEELKYAYTLSKSQDVMQLRKDLHEGSSCSVCGATHHPFHSDTLLEQSKLIGQLKTDYEQAASLLKHKTLELADIKKQQALIEGKMTMAYEAIEIYKQVLHENVAQWQSFVKLDHSFRECSASTNFEGRKIMLQQLLEKTVIDADAAQKELDKFNFHQQNIITLNEKIALKEQEKSEVTIRLNEVNTGSQVLAYQAEQLQQSYTRACNRFSEMYSEIDSMMSISNWYKVWCDTPENLRVYIQQQMEKWNTLKKDSVQLKLDTTHMEAKKQAEEERIKYLKKQKELILYRIEQKTEMLNMAQNSLYKLFADGDVDGRNKEIIENLNEQAKRKHDALMNAAEAKAAAVEKTGYNNRFIDEQSLLENQLAQDRSELDFWIRRYNASHSPVQFSELEQSFNSNRNWNALRENVRNLTLKNMLAAAREEESRLALAAHQVNALGQGLEKEDRTASLNSEIARLEGDKQRIQMNIAATKARIEAHEQALQNMATQADSCSTTLT